MNVLHILWDGHSGGTQRYVNAIASASPDHRIILLANPGREIPADSPKLEMAFGLSSGFDWRRASLLRRFVKANRPAVLHLHCDSPAFLHQAHCFPRQRIIYTEHGDSIVRAQNTLPTFLLWRRASANIDAVILNSNFAREIFLKKQKWATTKSTVLPNPLLEAAPDRPPRRPGPFRVGCIGRLHPVKGFDRLLKAAIHIQTPIDLHIYGEGDELDHLRTLAAHLPHSVAFHGFTNTPLLAIADLDLLVIPSRQEAFGLTALEAQAMGTPVLAHPTGGLPERINHGHDGILANCEHPVTLAATIERLATNPALRNQLATQAHTNAAKHSLDAHLKSLKQIHSTRTASNV